MRFPGAGAALLVGLWAGPLTAAPAPPSDGAEIVIHAGRLLDRPGQAPRGPSTIVVRNGRIDSIREGFVDGARGATVIELRDRFVLPGLIDCHVHLRDDRAGVAAQLAAVSRSQAARAYDAAAVARKTLEAGITTVRNLGDADGVTLALRDAIAAGQVPGPRILDAGNVISTTSGHADPTLGFREELHEFLDRHENLCDGPESCRRAVRVQIRRGVDVVKIATTGGVNSRIGAGVGAQMFADEVKALVETAHLYGKKVAVHAHGADGIKLALAAGADSIEHGTLLDEEGIQLFLKTGAYYVPTLSTVNGYLERLRDDPNTYSPEVREKIEWRLKVTGEALKRAYPRGVKIAFGTDAAVSKHGRNADELELMVKYGMPPAAALVAATVNAADLLGLAREIGTLEPGKRADLIAVGGDPLVDVTVLKQVAFVMKDGRVVRAPDASMPRTVEESDAGSTAAEGRPTGSQ
jgi:imidazolonepropionase-like amidohydrolase